MDFELPSNNINIIAGNDYDFQNNIIMALNMYFGTLKESNDDIEYNGDNLKLYERDLLVSKKEYRLINLDISNINLEDEIKKSKNSLVRDIINNYLNCYYEKSDLWLLVSSIFEQIEEKLRNTNLFQNEIGNELKLEISLTDLTSKIILDDILQLELKKNQNSIPLNFLTFYDQIIIMINIIDEYLKLNNNDGNIILIVNNIDNKFTDTQIIKVYNLLKDLAKYSNIYIYIFTNNKFIISQDNNMRKTVITNVNNSTVYLENIDDYIKKINEYYPIFISNDVLNDKVTNAILNNIEYIGNYVAINDVNIPNIEEISIIKILNDILEFKYDLKITNKQVNSHFYSFLTSN